MVVDICMVDIIEVGTTITMDIDTDLDTTTTMDTVTLMVVAIEHNQDVTDTIETKVNIIGTEETETDQRPIIRIPRKTVDIIQIIALEIQICLRSTVATIIKAEQITTERADPLPDLQQGQVRVL